MTKPKIPNGFYEDCPICGRRTSIHTKEDLLKNKECLAHREKILWGKA